MPKLKNVFTSGKMNKDLDERLVPNGEYRHAANVEVSTSDKEGVGVVKNIKGNQSVVTWPTNTSDNLEISTYYAKGTGYKQRINTVASIADNENEKFFWLTTGESIGRQAFDKSSGIFSLRDQPIDTNGIKGWTKKDIIFEVTKSMTSTSSFDFNIQPVFVDIFQFGRTQINTDIVPTGISIGSIFIEDGRYIEKNMSIRAICSNSAFDELENRYSDHVFVKSVGLVPTLAHPYRTQIVLSHPQNIPSAYTPIMFIFERKKVLNFDKDNLITGLNIIDDLLFWTDGVSEPKKINVSRSKLGTDFSGDVHTKLFRNNTLVSPTEYVKEEHITVIKPAPKTSPNIHVNLEGREGVLECNATTTSPKISKGIDIQMKFEGDNDRPSFLVNDIILIQSQTLELTSPLPENFSFKVQIKEITGTPLNSIVCKARVVYMASNATNAPDDYRARLEEVTQPIFETKFPRFAYRYKFEDGEYSPTSPFTDVVFFPDNYNYHPKEAYNLGMKNTIKELVLKDFVSPYIPKDVTEIDILYKEEKSPNIYSIDTIKVNDPLNQNFNGAWYNSWTHPGSFAMPNAHTGSYKILSENIYASLPEDQTLRHWDFVPKKAIAQEIVANRLVYGNYTHGYNLKDFANQIVKPKINVGYEPRIGGWLDDGETAVGRKSLKSLRTYKLGLAYLDKYGRQTPVFTDKDSSVTIPKIESINANNLTTVIENEPPHWAEYYKVFVKEITNEYYNLAMDRIYEAGDDNVWISFPSAERNKVDEDTYLILKKKPDVNGSQALVSEEGKYKVIAIENEAPDFVKTRNKKLGSVNGFPTLFDHTGGDHVASAFIPGAHVNQKQFEFLIGDSSTSGSNYGWVGQGGESDQDEMEKATHIQFLSDSGYQSPRYEINNINAEISPSRYHVEIKGDGIADHDFQWLSGTNPSNSSSGTQYGSVGICSGITVVIYKSEIKNLPEFDGRFFVKIRKDELVVDNLYTKQTSSQKQITAGSTGVYYFADDLAPKWGRGHKIQKNEFVFGTITSANAASTPSSNTASYNTGVHSDFVTNDVTGSNVGASHRVADWDSLIGTSSKWFIDQAFYAIAQGGSEPSPHNPNAYKWGMGFGRGIYEINGGNAAVMELAFAGIKPDPLTNPASNNPTNWVVGEASNKSHDQESSTTRRIFNGSQFKFADDPDGTIYTIINNPYKMKRVNHTSLFEANSGNVFKDTSTSIVGASQWDQYQDQLGQTIHSYGATRNPFAFSAEFCPWGLPHFTGRLASEPNVANMYNLINAPNPTRTHPNGALQAFNVPNSVDPDMHAKEYFTNNKWNRVNIQNATTNPGLYGTDPDINTPNIFMPFTANGAKFLQSNNRRVTWRFKISPSPFQQNWNPIDPAKHSSNSTLMPKADRATSIIWLKPDEGDESLNQQSSNPAVFETEPRSNVDLDMYHETNMQYPIYLDDVHGYDFAPVGSKVFTSASLKNDPNIEILPSDAIVYSWDDTRLQIWSDTAGGIVTFDLGEISFSNNEEFTFIRPDGNYTTANLNVNLSFTNSQVVDSLLFNRNVSKNRIGLSWYNCFSFQNGVESDRIRDDFNAETINNGPKVSTISLRQYKEEVRKSGLVYSSLYNSKTGLNGLNQFIEANKITKDLNPVYGSVQKLFTRNTDLVAFCEDRVLKILANKDALYNADGNPQLISSNAVLGQAQPFVGDYGISKNPESFSSESYRVYFTDKSRGAVMRLSLDGLEPISDHGMKSWFNENLKYGEKLLGSYDMKKMEYNLTILPFNEREEYITFNLPNWIDIPIYDDPLGAM